MTTKTPRSIWFLLIGILALVAVGCGGDDSSSSGGDASDATDTAEPLSEDEFVEQFNDACTETDDDLEAIPDPESYEEVVELAGEATDIATDGIATLQEIVPPEDLADDVDELLSLLEDRVALNEDLIAAAEDEDDQALQDVIDEGENIDEDIDGIAEDLGIDCFADEEDLTSDFSDDTSSDFSSDFSSEFSELGDPVEPPAFIAEYGTDAQFDALADSCFAGGFADCDTLYAQSPIDASINSYEGYGATCGGRLPNEEPNTCASRG